MADATTPNTQNTASLSALIAAGEEIFTAITGRSSANVEKVTSGLSAVGDGLLPTLESKVSFDLGKVIAGTTGIFAGVALVLAGLKKKAGASASTATSTATAGTAQTAITGGVG